MSTEISKVLNPALYPDLVQSGGLSPALQRVLQQLSADLSVKEVVGISPGWAGVRKGSRESSVCVALYERAFHVDFWNQGVLYGQGWTSELTEVGRAIEMFQVQKASTARMKSDFSWFDIGEGLVHERGADSFVTEHWRSLKHWLTSKVPQTSEMRRLVPIVLEAANRPELRQLFPFRSLDVLCFSRTTGYPFSRDCPVAVPIEGGRFRILSAGGKSVLGEGDAVQAADILIANLPQNCGPAIHGTAEK